MTARSSPSASGSRTASSCSTSATSRFQLFSCIRRNGGYFIVRLKKSADPTVVAIHRRWRGRAVPIIGRRVSQFLGRLKRQAVDVEVELAFKRRAYGGVRHKDREGFRLVGVRDPVTRQYHLYLTNIPPDKLTPNDIAQTYAARWLIELFFRELKTHYRAEDMPHPPSATSSRRSSTRC